MKLRCFRPVWADAPKCFKPLSFRNFAGDGQETRFYDVAPAFMPKQGPARTRDGQILPTGWVEYKSPAKGVYYAHAATGVTQYHLPTGAPTKAQIEDAFREKYADRMAQLQPGVEVRLVGLRSSPDLEGKVGICKKWDAQSGYIHVKLATGELKAVKPQNLQVTSVHQSGVPKSNYREAPDRVSQQTSSRTRSFLLLGLAIPLLYWLTRSFWNDALPPSSKEKVMEQPSESKLLPPGWCQHRDPTTGRLYYWREADPEGSRTWHRPTG